MGKELHNAGLPLMQLCHNAGRNSNNKKGLVTALDSNNVEGLWDSRIARSRPTKLDQVNSYLSKVAVILDTMLQDFRHTPGGQPPHQGSNDGNGIGAANSKAGTANVGASEPSAKQTDRKKMGKEPHNAGLPLM